MKTVFNSGHYLTTLRLDVWIAMLFRIRFRISRRSVPQALLITLTALILSPFALLEALIFAIPVRMTKIRKDPIFIVGNWRTGTTFLQNILTRDPQFAWMDPIHSLTINYCGLLGPLMARILSKHLPDARPQDNMEYDLDMPMEDAFAMASLSTMSIIHAIAFPENHPYFVESSFVQDLPPRRRRIWQRRYMYLLKKLTLMKGGRQLVLKSPDNTCRIAILREMFPDARFIYLSRDPYRVITSTLNMFRVEMDILSLQDRTPEMDNTIEDVFISLYDRICREAHKAEAELPSDRFMTLRYTALTRDTEASVREIYRTLALDGIDEALPRMRAYLQTQKGYRKNRFETSPELRKKINSRLEYVFTHDGYDMEDI